MILHVELSKMSGCITMVISGEDVCCGVVDHKRDDQTPPISKGHGRG